MYPYPRLLEESMYTCLEKWTQAEVCGSGEWQVKHCVLSRPPPSPLFDTNHQSSQAVNNSLFFKPYFLNISSYIFITRLSPHLCPLSPFDTNHHFSFKIFPNYFFIIFLVWLRHLLLFKTKCLIRARLPSNAQDVTSLWNTNFSFGNLLHNLFSTFLLPLKQAALSYRSSQLW